MTAKEKDFLARYNIAIKYCGYRHIKSCYKWPSKTKLAIWHDIAMQCHELHGTGLTVVSFNVYMFTAAFKYKKDGKEYLRFYSPSCTIDVEVPNE